LEKKELKDEKEKDKYLEFKKKGIISFDEKNKITSQFLFQIGINLPFSFS
jgi:hypothetical protein